jgi:hypothetical protein
VSESAHQKPGPLAGRKSNNPNGRPRKLGNAEQWMMRVNPEFHAHLLKLAKRWDVSGAELVRLVVERGFEEELLEPPKPGEMLKDRLHRGSRRH